MLPQYGPPPWQYTSTNMGTEDVDLDADLLTLKMDGYPGLSSTFVKEVRDVIHELEFHDVRDQLRRQMTLWLVRLGCNYIEPEHNLAGTNLTVLHGPSHAVPIFNCGAGPLGRVNDDGIFVPRYPNFVFHMPPQSARMGNVWEISDGAAVTHDNPYNIPGILFPPLVLSPLMPAVMYNPPRRVRDEDLNRMAGQDDSAGWVAGEGGVLSRDIPAARRRGTRTRDNFDLVLGRIVPTHVVNQGTWGTHGTAPGHTAPTVHPYTTTHATPGHRVWCHVTDTLTLWDRFVRCRQRLFTLFHQYEDHIRKHMKKMIDRAERRDAESEQPDQYTPWLNHPFARNPTMNIHELPEITAHGLYTVLRDQYNRCITDFIIHQIPTLTGPVPALVGLPVGAPIDYTPDHVIESMRAFHRFQEPIFRRPWMGSRQGFLYDFEIQIPPRVWGAGIESFHRNGLPL